MNFLKPKRLAKQWLCACLEKQVVALRAANPGLRVVAVAGSMGKTSTKLAVAQTLEAAGLRVRYQSGNYNDRLTVPLVVFGQELPNLANLAAWWRIWQANRRVLAKPFDYDFVVLELGTDGPGQIAEFAYLQPDLTIITGVAPEHMEYFGSLDAVAREELAVVKYSQQLLINVDDTAAIYLPASDSYLAYSLTDNDATYHASGVNRGLQDQTIKINRRGKTWANTDIAYLGLQGRKIVLAAAAAADIMGVKPAAVTTALSQLKPFAGRMQILEGIHNSTIIDDTYNASPAAVEAALNVLLTAKAPQRIAVLGSMNELGDFSPEAHRTIGASLDAGRLDAVVTIGRDARDYLAPAAEAAGCWVVSFDNPLAAGQHVKKILKHGAVVLFKGSQNGVFAEEAIKPILADPKDAAKLVRQSTDWLAKKRQQFKVVKLA